MSDATYWLTSERLRLRRFREDDLDWLVAFYADAEAVQYLGGSKTRAQVEELLQTRILRYYDDHPGLGIWMTVDRATEQPLGFHLVNTIHGEHIIQIGYGLVKPAWGRGLATEMALALLRYAFLELGLPEMCAIAHLGNVASQRVLTKIGLERRGERAFPHPAYAAAGPMAWFERDAASWRRQFAPPPVE